MALGIGARVAGVSGGFIAYEAGARAFRGLSPRVPRREVGSAAELWAQYAFLLDAGTSEAALRSACDEGSSCRLPPHLLLIHAGHLSGPRYLEILQERIMSSAPRGMLDRSEVVDALPFTPREVDEAVAQVRRRGNAPLLLMPQQIDWSAPPETRRWRADQAANGLLRRRPELSAGAPYATWQVLLLPILPGLVLGGLLVMPWLTLLLVGAIIAIPFIFVVTLRILALLAVLWISPRRPKPSIPDATLPVYSVIVAVYREADVVPGLVESLKRLDYPAAKLDIIIAAESVDRETVAALNALELPPHFRVLVVPDVPPRTKPRALNYALRHARGDYIVIYDAEDDPEPDQLRRAVRMYAERPPNLMCVQGRLALYNEHPGWIARQFMLEYAALFDAVLHALVRLRLPVPLGGTSNHFPRQVLEDLGAWDAYNVTEDADLGIRIARAGGVVAVLDSTTWEEAPDRPGTWGRQRTRWMKGYMQTWLVHMRSPRRLLRDLGPWGFFGFNAFLGGVVLSALVHPFVLIAIAWAAMDGRLLAPADTLLGAVLLAFAFFNLAGGYLSGMATASLAAWRRGLLRLLPDVLVMPFYWLLISIATYRALLQLVTHPHLWEKTPHSRREAGGVRPDATGSR